MRRNVSKKVENGTFVKFNDSYLEHGKNTKGKNDSRLGVVIDTNRRDEIAILKRQHAKNSVQLGEDSFNPNIKIKNKNDKPLKIDNDHVKKVRRKKISRKEANQLKKQVLKNQPKNVRKPNRTRLRILKGRK